MRRRSFLSAAFSHLAAAIVLTSGSGCGSILHPERRGQPHNHQIDWKIAALNGLGLVLFFVPGVIAFAVDFYTGAIYLPPQPMHHGYSSNTPASSQSLRRIDLPEPKQTIAGIEHSVSQHIGYSVKLDDDSRVSELAVIDDFDQRLVQHQQDKSFGQSIRQLLAFHS